MRPGLVAVGVVFVVLGAGAIVTLSLSTPPTSNNSDAFAVSPSAIHPGDRPHAAFLQGMDTGSGTFRLHWQATVPMTVKLYLEPGCTAPASCPLGTPVALWPSNLSGNWSAQGALQFPYLIVWSLPGPVAGEFQTSGEEQWNVADATPMLTTLLVDGSGGALAAVGAIAIFLGLFLRGGIYRSPPPLVSRSAEDAEAIAAQDAPGASPSRR